METSDRQAQVAYVLVVIPCDETRKALLEAVARAGKVPLVCQTVEEAHEALRHENVAIVLCDDRLPASTVEAILLLVREQPHPIPVIITSRTGGWDEFLKALRQGAFDYLPLPPHFAEVKRVLDLAEREVQNSKGAAKTTPGRAGALVRLHHNCLEPLSHSFSTMPPAFHRTPRSNLS